MICDYIYTEKYIKLNDSISFYFSLHGNISRQVLQSIHV